MKYIISTCVLLLILGSCKENNTQENVDQKEVLYSDNQKSKTQEWTVLFDGSNFNHWKGYLSEEMPSEWSIEEKAMVFTPSQEGGNNIITKETFENFQLHIEWKIAEGGNSGIFWGVYEDEQFGEAYQTGPEIQVLDNAKHPDAKVADGTHTAGSLYDMIKAPEGLIRPAGEWNTVLLEVNHITNQGKVTLNGEEAFSFPVHGKAWKQMIANSKFATWKGFGEYRDGHIGLQDHGDKVWYRNIKIKRIE